MITLAFTGVGRTAHGGSNEHFHAPGETIVNHLVGTRRHAAFTGTIAGREVLARDLEAAVIGHLEGGGVDVCHAC